MFLHQALPKDIQTTHKPTYSIRKRMSPARKNPIFKNERTSQQRSKESLDVKGLHRINSKEKPGLMSPSSKDSIPSAKMISTSIRKNYSRQNSSDKIVTNPFRTSEVQTPRENVQRPLRKNNEIILCKFENKLASSYHKQFNFHDLSSIDQKYWLSYEGQTTGNRVRQGFGTQYFSNGQKFMGHFINDSAEGQGTYYGLRRKVMGLWESNSLKQKYLQL